MLPWKVVKAAVDRQHSSTESKQVSEVSVRQSEELCEGPTACLSLALLQGYSELFPSLFIFNQHICLEERDVQLDLLRLPCVLFFSTCLLSGPRAVVTQCPPRRDPPSIT